jgi:hypothetical protein
VEVLGLGLGLLCRGIQRALTRVCTSHSFRYIMHTWGALSIFAKLFVLFNLVCQVSGWVAGLSVDPGLSLFSFFLALVA